MTRCTTACLLALALAWPAHAQTPLRYRFKAGDTHDRVLDQKMKIAMNVNGMDIDMKVNQTVDISFRVQKVDDRGNAQVRVKFGRTKMNLEGITGDLQLDSDDAEEAKDPMGKALQQVVRAMAACDMTFTMTPTGDVKDVVLSEAARKKLQELPSGQGGGFSNFTSEGGLKAMVQGGPTFPAEAVAKGASWTQQRDHDMPFGKIKVTTKYTYEGREEKDGRTLEKIAAAPQVKFEPDPDAPVKLDFKSIESKGRTLFDNATGQPVETATETTMQVSVDVNGMTITQNIVQETTVRPKKGR